MAAAVAQARSRTNTLRARPEYEQFARTRDRLARQQELTAAQERPRLSAFGRVGYGQPGLNFIDDAFESYGLGGVRLQWNAWTWGAGAREREALALQQQIVAADEAAFAKGLSHAIEGDETAIDRLQRSLATDERIVDAARAGRTLARSFGLQEGVVTASEYLDRSTELLQARFARAGHQVELAQASARLLTTLGLECGDATAILGFGTWDLGFGDLRPPAASSRSRMRTAMSRRTRSSLAPRSADSSTTFTSRKGRRSRRVTRRGRSIRRSRRFSATRRAHSVTPRRRASAKSPARCRR